MLSSFSSRRIERFRSIVHLFLFGHASSLGLAILIDVYMSFIP